MSVTEKKILSRLYCMNTDEHILVFEQVEEFDDEEGWFGVDEPYCVMDHFVGTDWWKEKIQRIPPANDEQRAIYGEELLAIERITIDRKYLITDKEKYTESIGSGQCEEGLLVEY